MPLLALNLVPDGSIWIAAQCDEPNRFIGISHLRTGGTEGSDNGDFEDPMGVTVDAAGFVYVVDLFNQRIQKFTAKGAFQGAWGAEVLEAPFNVPVSRSGMVYVADGGNAVVQQFEPA